jgi:hypothetical protein
MRLFIRRQEPITDMAAWRIDNVNQMGKESHDYVIVKSI